MDKAWSRRINYYYGISSAEYHKLFKDQNGVCAICGQLPDKIRLSVDHNHSSKRVRGLLCNPCNLVLGLMKDKHEVVLNAYNYLKKHNEIDKDWDIDYIRKKMEACGI